jgi:Eukaryotic and archaeal DNA primase, large subunit
MQQLHSSVRAYHHLKHWGRQQYGLFLKGIGLSLEEALRFWKSEFTRIMDADKVFCFLVCRRHGRRENETAVVNVHLLIIYPFDLLLFNAQNICMYLQFLQIG